MFNYKIKEKAEAKNIKLESIIVTSEFLEKEEKKLTFFESFEMTERIKNPLTILSMLGFDITEKIIRGGIWDNDSRAILVKKDGQTYHYFRNVGNIVAIGTNLKGYSSAGEPDILKCEENAVLFPVNEKDEIEKEKGVIIIIPERIFYDYNKYADWCIFRVPYKKWVGHDINCGMQWLGADKYPCDIAFAEEMMLNIYSYNFEGNFFYRDDEGTLCYIDRLHRTWKYNKEAKRNFVVNK